jgi:hypothetical protein
MFFGFSLYLRIINQGLVSFLSNYIPLIVDFIPIVLFW